MSVSGDVIKFWITTVVYVFSAIILTCLLIIHWRKHYQDLYTEERLSVAHRRNKPAITQAYKLVALFTSLNVLCSTFHCYVLVFNLLLPFAYVDSSVQVQKRVCKWTIAFSGTITIPKLMVYYVFLLRLHLVYGGTQYAVSVKNLKRLSVVLTIWMCGLAFWFVWCGAVTIDNKDPWRLIFTKADGIIYCEPNVDFLFFLNWGTYDVFVNLVFCYYFFKPIRDVMKKMQASMSSTISGTNTKKLSKKMIAVGIKVAVLSVALAVSTMILSMLWVVIVINLFAFDDLVNTLCLILMTPYYPDKQWYHRLCKGFICCFDRSGYTYQVTDGNDDTDNDKKQENMYDPTVTKTTTTSSGSTGASATSGSNATSAASGSGSGTTNVSSVDTESAPRIAANQFGALNDNSNGAPNSVNSKSPSLSGEGLAFAILDRNQQE